MKVVKKINLYILLSFLVSHGVLLSQNKGVSGDLPPIGRSTNHPIVSVTLPNMKTLFIGIDNLINISTPEIDADKLIIEIENGTVRKISDDNNYIVRITNTTSIKNTAKMTIKETKVDHEEIIYSSEFKVRRVPNPVATIDGMTDGIISKTDLMNAGKIITHQNENDMPFEITGFTFAIVIQGDWIPKNVSGSYFSSDVLGIIKHGRHKQKLFFTNIKAIGPDGSMRALNPIILELQ